jgi:hypothetical protein
VACEPPSRRALRKPSARCGASLASNAASAGVKFGLDLSRCRPLIVSAAAPFPIAAEAFEEPTSGLEPLTCSRYE